MFNQPYANFLKTIHTRIHRCKGIELYHRERKRERESSRSSTMSRDSLLNTIVVV